MQVGDKVLWAGTNGNVRTGRLLEWLPDEARWFVEIYPSGNTDAEQGFPTWFKPESLIKVEETQ